jgi:hypothetical protein
MKKLIAVCVVAVLFLTSVNVSLGALTGDPEADGWTYQGHSLENGTYCRGSGNIGFDVYTTMFTVTDSSEFVMSSPDHPYYEDLDPHMAREWAVGDTIVGVGGVFSDITAAESGWASFPSSLTNVQADDKLRLQAKFGPSDEYYPSTTAPGSGNGGGSSDYCVEFVRTSGYLHPNDTNNYENWWALFAGEMMGQQNHSLYKDGDLARLIWTWDAENNRPGSWEILLNTTLGEYPTGYNSEVIASVQYDNPYTDAFATIVPEPGTLVILGLGGVLLRRRK